MINRFLGTVKSNGFEGKFKTLNNNEMTTLRGGGEPPLPPTGGDDYPIDILKGGISGMTSLSVQPVPVLTTEKVLVPKTDKK